MPDQSASALLRTLGGVSPVKGRRARATGSRALAQFWFENQLNQRSDPCWSKSSWWFCCWRSRAWAGGLSFERSAAVAASSFRGTPHSPGQGSSHVREAGRGEAPSAAAQPPCSICHRLHAAGAYSTIGPNLDRARPSYRAIVSYVTHGGSPTPRHPTSLQSAGGVLTRRQIENLAAFVYAATHRWRSRCSLDHVLQQHSAAR